jgi:2-polyprenyl-3-methyl-5-hydroxy-6-metoxy-1,4-benzoquinol methylase
VEVSQARVARAQAEHPGITFVQGDAAAWGKEGCADVVVCTEVIEHVAEPEALLTNIRRILSDSGVALIGTLNDPIGRYVDGVEHVTAYGAELLEQQAEAAGFAVIARASTVPGIYGPGGLLAAPETLVQVMARAEAGGWAWDAGSNLFVLLRKHADAAREAA